MRKMIDWSERVNWLENRTLGEWAQLKILVSLRERYPDDLTIKDISNSIWHAPGMRLNRDTVAKYLPVLIKKGEVEFTRQVSTAKFYRAKSNPEITMNLLIKLQKNLLRESKSASKHHYGWSLSSSEVRILESCRTLLERRISEIAQLT